jgi:hypothetical protein
MDSGDGGIVVHSDCDVTEDDIAKHHGIRHNPSPLRSGLPMI